MKKLINRTLLLILLAIAISSCATILSGTKQPIRINSFPSGAKVIINGKDKGLITPCVVNLKRKVKPTTHNNRNEYHYLMEKEGFATTEFLDYRKINGKIYWNCVIYPFAFISFPIDFISGAAYRYNDELNITLSPVQNKQVIAENKVIPEKTNEDKTPPAIKIIKPDLSRGFKPTVSDEYIEITGTAYDENGIFSVTINGVPAKTSLDGTFTAEIKMIEGSNKITILAKDKNMNTSSESFYLERESIQSNNITNESELISNFKYYALIIGIEDYLDPNLSDLDEPVKDAQRLYNSLLQNYQFDAENVVFLQNPTKDEITQVLEKYFKTLGSNDNLLIFYAGHGYWDDKFKQGYWLTADSKTDNRGTWLSNSTIRDYLRAISCRHSLLITDACFAGGIFKSREAFPDASKAINELYKLPSRKAFTSGALNEVPDKSVFLEYLIKRLEENDQKYLSAEQLFASFKIAVINNSPDSQVPQFGEIKETGDEGGDFIFIRK
jgi:hypothetical protein